MNKAPLLTIVVPAYNVERFLEQCLSSLYRQTVTAHKVIVVNDGSKDRTGEIAQQYANEHPEMFTYICQENKGLGAARNTGLARVDTPYVGFLDSDDWLMPRYVEKIVQRLEQEQETPDMLFTLPIIYDMASGMFQEWADTQLFWQLFALPGTAVNAKENPRVYALEPSSCRRIYRMEFMKQQAFRFPEGTKWEDVEPHFQLLRAANRCIGEGSVGFIYRINSGGQITSSAGKGRLQVVSVFSKILSMAFSQGWDNIEISYILKMMVNFSDWCINCSSVSVRKELVQKLHELYSDIPEQCFKNYFGDLSVGRKEKMFIELLRSPFYSVIGEEHNYKLARGAAHKVLRLVGKA